MPAIVIPRRLDVAALDQADLDLSKVVNYYERLPNQVIK